MSLSVNHAEGLETGLKALQTRSFYMMLSYLAVQEKAHAGVDQILPGLDLILLILKEAAQPHTRSCNYKLSNHKIEGDPVLD
jgi:hypothetical protein